MTTYAPKHTELQVTEVAVIHDGQPTDERLFIFETPAGRAMVDAATFLTLYAPVESQPEPVAAMPNTVVPSKLPKPRPAKYKKGTPTLRAAILSAVGDGAKTESGLTQCVFEALRGDWDRFKLGTELDVLQLEKKIRFRDGKWHLVMPGEGL